jgi:hypothetical protein
LKPCSTKVGASGRNGDLLAAAHGERAQFAAAHMRQHLTEDVEAHRNDSGQHVGEQRRAAAIRHGGELDARRFLQHHAGKM